MTHLLVDLVKNSTTIPVGTIVMICAGLSQLAYTLCFLPQIVTNYRLKSGEGVSDLSLLSNFNLQMAVLYYIFLLDLPLAYKLCSPVQLMLASTLIVQRLWYGSGSKIRPLIFLYLANITCLLALLPYGLNNPIFFGHITGWISAICGFLGQFTQVIKIWRKRSVAGFDKGFVYALLCAGIVELLGAVIGGLPLETMFSCFRVIIFSLIMLWQFKRYAKHHAR